MSSARLEQRRFRAAAPWTRTESGGPVPSASLTRLWRPWTWSHSDSGRGHRTRAACPYSRAMVPGCFSSDGKPQTFQHPVRLFWPKSKSFDYLYSDGEALLRNFPVQATISFYEDSDSDDDEDEDDEDDPESEGEDFVKPGARPPTLN